MTTQNANHNLFKQVDNILDFKIFWDKELGNKITKRNTRSWMAHSPFHADKTASFSIPVVGPKAGTYKDFGGESGNWVTFLKQMHGFDSYQALEYVITNYVPELSPSLKQSSKENIIRISREEWERIEKAFTPKSAATATKDTTAIPAAVALTDDKNVASKDEATDGDDKKAEPDAVTYRTTIYPEYDKIISQTFQDAFWADPEAVKFQTQVRKHSEAVLRQVGIGKISPEIIDTLRKKVPEEYLLERGLLKSGFNGPDLEPFIWFDAYCYEHFSNGQSSRFTIKPFDKSNPPVMITKQGHWLEGDLFLNGDCLIKLQQAKDKQQPVFVVEGQNDFISVVEYMQTEYLLCTIGALSEEQKKSLVTLILEGYNVRLAFDNDHAGIGYLKSIAYQTLLMWEQNHSNGNRTKAPQLNFLAKFPKIKHKDGTTSECKDIDDALKIVSAQDVIDGFVTLDLFDLHGSRLSYRIIPTLEKVKDNVTDGELHELYNLDDHSLGIAFAGIKCLKNDDIPYFEVLTNFTGEIKEIVTKRIWDFSREVMLVEYVLSLRQGSRTITERINEDDFQDKKKLQAYLCRHLQNPMFQSKQVDIIRAYLRNSNPRPIIKNLTQQLGWDASKKIYYTRTAKVHGNGTVEPIDDYLLYTNNESIENRKYIKILTSERYQEVGSFVFKELLYIHDPVFVVSAISIAMGAWIKSFLLERFGKLTIYAFVGITSSGKTVVASIANAFDGNPQAFRTFQATPNAVMRDAALLVDHLLLLDDAKTENMCDQSEKAWLRLFQSFYDGQGRARMTDTTRLDGRCGLLVTGENTLKLQSSLGGRIFEIPVIPYSQVQNGLDKKLIHAKHLHYLNDLCGLKAPIINFMLAMGIEKILSCIAAYAIDFENCTNKTNNVARLAHAAAELRTLSEIFLNFGVAEGFCQQEQANSLKIRINRFLRDRVKQQADEVEKLSISQVYIDAIQGMLASGKYGLQYDSPNDILNDNSPIILGTLDATHIYILPEVSICEVRKVLAHSPLRITAKNVSTSLQEDGIMISKGAIEKQFHNVKASYWMFDRATFKSELVKTEKEETHIDTSKLTSVDSDF